jgi:hypothetical protein
MKRKKLYWEIKYDENYDIKKLDIGDQKEFEDFKKKV